MGPDLMDDATFLMELKFFIETQMFEMNNEELTLQEMIDSGDMPVVYDELLRRLHALGFSDADS
jgi:hypothetical protein